MSFFKEGQELSVFFRGHFPENGAWKTRNEIIFQRYMEVILQKILIFDMEDFLFRR